MQCAVRPKKSAYCTIYPCAVSPLASMSSAPPLSTVVLDTPDEQIPEYLLDVPKDHIFMENGFFRTPEAWLQAYNGQSQGGNKERNFWSLRYDFALSLAPHDPHVLPYEPMQKYLDRARGLGISAADAKAAYHEFSHDPRNVEILAHDNDGCSVRRALLRKVRVEERIRGG